MFDYKEQFSVSGKKCIVTGGAQGLSRGMAEGLLENGAEVVLMDLQAEKLEEVVAEYKAQGYKAYAVAGDLSQKSEIDRMFDEAMELLGGRLDVMVPAAGIQRRYEPWEFPEEQWRLVIEVDLNHVWFMCQKAIQVMKDKETVGKIINIASMNSYFGGTTVPAYSAAKGAIVSLTRSIASDCADHSICCNAIAPGYMDTEMCANMTQARKDECTARIPAARWGTPEDVKGPVIFLASSASDYLNGATIPVDGGFLTKS